MNMMTFEHFETTFKRDLAAAGLREFVEWKSSQFLDCGSEFFVELVLNDGSKISEAEVLLGQTAEDLHRDGVRLDGVVRAVWRVDDVTHAGPARTPDGGLRAATAFAAKLISGNTECSVLVDVTFSATEMLRRKHADLSCSPKRSIAADELTAVKRYLERQLSLGGTSYWNPLKYSRCELNEPAMFFLCSLGLN